MKERRPMKFFLTLFLKLLILIKLIFLIWFLLKWHGMKLNKWRQYHLPLPVEFSLLKLTEMMSTTILNRQCIMLDIFLLYSCVEDTFKWRSYWKSVEPNSHYSFCISIYYYHRVLAMASAVRWEFNGECVPLDQESQLDYSLTTRRKDMSWLL